MLLAVSVTVMSRPKLGPPSIQLKTEISNIALVELTAKSADSLTFKLLENIHNQATEQIQVRSKASTSQLLVVGRSYIIGYIAWQVNRPSKEVVPKVGGAVLMSLPGAEPAIFADTAAVKQMLQWDVTESLTSPVAMLPLIKAGLASDDYQTRNFYITELITRKAFMGSAEIKSLIKELVLDTHVDWRIKHFILANQGLDETQLKSTWFKQWATAMLTHSSTQFDPFGSDAALIKQLLLLVPQHINDSQQTVVSRWLQSNQVGVVESALGVLKQLDLDAAISQVESRLQHSLLDEAMRFTLQNYLKRLNNQKQQKLNSNHSEKNNQPRWDSHEK